MTEPDSLSRAAAANIGKMNMKPCVIRRGERVREILALGKVVVILKSSMGGWVNGRDNGRSNQVHSNSVSPPEHKASICDKWHCCEELTIVDRFINRVDQLFGRRYPGEAL